MQCSFTNISISFDDPHINNLADVHVILVRKIVVSYFTIILDVIILLRPILKLSNNILL
jgi:hypothetical protein